MSDLIVIQADPVAHLTDYGRWLLGQGNPPMQGGAGMSAFLEGASLNHFTKQAAYTPAGGFLALCTTTPTVASTGTTIVEAAYTGYARQTTSALWGAATGSNPASSSNSGAITFAACTASTSTVQSWAFCDAVTVGNALFWGTCPSTVISATQTPATVAIAGLVFQMT